MKTQHLTPLGHRVQRWLRRLAAPLFALASSAVLAAGNVAVEQQPLFTAQAVPPNIMLMLDDSGSMERDYIPDADYFSSRGLWNSVYLRNAAINPLYYDPTVTYLPPPKADGVPHSNSPTTAFTSAYLDGFNGGTRKNITTWSSEFVYWDRYLVRDSQPRVPNGVINTCKSGYHLNPGEAECLPNNPTVPANRSCPSAKGGGYFDVGLQKCVPPDNTGGEYPPPAPYDPTLSCPDGFRNLTETDPANGTCDAYSSMTPGVTTTYDACPAGYYVSGLNCYKDNWTYAFAYATGPQASQVTHHVASTGNCAKVTTPAPSVCVEEGDVSGIAAPAGIKAGDNIANWFSFYRSRMLMAKSNLMFAFYPVKEDFRIGFGSINNQGAGDITGGVDFNAITLAPVAPLGVGGGSTQKGALWSWLRKLNAHGPTPLQQALDAVGQYYEDDQPWVSPDPRNHGADTMFACRQAYTILTTDGYWHSNVPLPAIGNIDGTAGTEITGAGHAPFTYAPVDPFQDAYSDTLADVAMKYWNRDLKSNIDNRVPTSSVNPAFWQHMSTFTIGLGIDAVDEHGAPLPTSQLLEWGLSGGAAVPGFAWPQPVDDEISTASDLLHAGINGRGGFYSATRPDEFRAALMDALGKTEERLGTTAAVAASSNELNTGTNIFKTEYTSGSWSGDLVAYPVDADGRMDAGTTSWRASVQLPSADDRNIHTFAKGEAPEYASFKNSGGGSPPGLTTAQLAALGPDAATQAEIVDYLRGDRAQERSNGGVLRNRATVLGDFGYSQPVFVGAPYPGRFARSTFTGSTAYAAFATAQQSRTNVVYVAANDGMLHGFDAATGKELYAYLPGAVITAGIADLADPAYGQGSKPHQFFNDGELTVADAYLGGAWKTVLVGTTGRGFARAVYALDVTDPGAIKFLWERSAGDGGSGAPLLGQMAGKPIVAQTADGEWSVILGNGYNSTANKAALLQFKLDDGDLSGVRAHLLDNTHKDDTPNGLAQPEVWLPNPSDGVASIAYAGDLMGNVWQFTLANAQGERLFSATDSGGVAQPITAGMVGAIDPKTHNQWLFFGTGNALSVEALDDRHVQSWYGIIVKGGDASYSASPALLKNDGRDALAQREIIAETADRRAFTGEADAGIDEVGPTHPGWFIDFQSPTGTGGAYVDQGERMVSTSQVVGGVLFNTSMIPESTDMCNPEGTGWLMFLNAFNGNNLRKNFADVSGDGVIDDSDSTTAGGEDVATGGMRVVSTPNAPAFIGGNIFVSQVSSAIAQVATAPGAGGLNRVSWREMVNP